MKVNSITSTPHFGVHKTKSITPKQSRSVHDGLSTAGVWFGFGIGLDLLSRKCRFSKSPFKNSLAINGIIAGAAGIITCVKDLKSNAE